MPRALLVAVLALALALPSTLAACAGAPSPASSAPAPRTAEAAPTAGGGAVDASSARAAVDAPDAAAVAVVGADAAASTGSPLSGVSERVESASSFVAIDLAIPRLGPTFIAVLVNVDAIRATSASSSLASIVGTSSMLQDFVNGDLRVDWALLSGPSLDQMDRDVAILRCSADDASMDAWLDAFSSRTRGGGAVPLSVPDTYAVSGNLEGTARVAMRVQHHLLAIAPVDLADDAAHALAGAVFPDRIDAREALRMREQRSKTQSFPDFVTPAVSELRIWFEPGPGPIVDAFVEEDTPTPAAAAHAAEAMRKWLTDSSVISLSTSTGGLFDHVEVATRARTATAHMHATREQVATTIALMTRLSGASRSRRP